MTDSTLPAGKDTSARVSTTPPGWPNYPMKVIVTEPPPEPQGPPEPTTPNEIALQGVCHQITALDPGTLALANSYTALKSLHARFAEIAVQQLLRQASQASSQLGHEATSNKIQHDFARGHGDELTKLAQIEAAMHALEADGKLAPALEMLDKLHAQRAALEAAVQADTVAKGQAYQDVLDAQAAALAKAQAAAESDPALAAARATLASFEPAAAATPVPLVRGRVKLPVDELSADLH